MEYVFKKNIDIKEYNDFISKFPMISFMQDANWAIVKDNWKTFHTGLYQNGKLIAVSLFLIRKLGPKIFMGYIPRGFVIDYNNQDILKEFTNNIRKLGREEHCYMVKIDPNFCFHETAFSEITKGEKKEIPILLSKNSLDYHKNLLALGYQHKGYPKAIDQTLQPRFHMMIPLIDKNLKLLNEEELLKSFKKKVQSTLGKYHANRGVFFEHTSDIQKLDEFIDILNSTEKRQKIHLRNKSYFEKIMKAYQEKAVLFFGKLDLNHYLSFLEKNNGNEEDILKVKTLLAEGKTVLTLSAALVIMPSNKKGIRTSEYLYAGNQLLFSKLQISLGLVYDICKYSIQNHCTYCNLGGIDGNFTDHLSVYKSKFNSIVMEFVGEYDLPICKILYYPIDFLLPILKKGYHFIRK